MFSPTQLYGRRKKIFLDHFFLLDCLISSQRDFHSFFSILLPIPAALFSSLNFHDRVNSSRPFEIWNVFNTEDCSAGGVHRQWPYLPIFIVTQAAICVYMAIWACVRLALTWPNDLWEIWKNQILVTEPVQLTGKSVMTGCSETNGWMQHYPFFS